MIMHCHLVTSFLIMFLLELPLSSLANKTIRRHRRTTGKADTPLVVSQSYYDDQVDFIVKASGCYPCTDLVEFEVLQDEELPTGATILDASVYFHSYNSPRVLPASGAINGVPFGPIQPISVDYGDDYFERVLLQTYKYNVTDLVVEKQGSTSSNNNNDPTTTSYNIQFSAPGKQYFGALMIVFRHDSLPRSSLWIKDGGDYIRGERLQTSFPSTGDDSWQQGQITVLTSLDDNGGSTEELRFNGERLLGPGNIFHSNLGLKASVIQEPVNNNNVDDPTKENVVEILADMTDGMALQVAILKVQMTTSSTTTPEGRSPTTMPPTTSSPSIRPSNLPSAAPTSSPTLSPSTVPTQSPTPAPTESPTTASPTSSSPTKFPTNLPSDLPTVAPTNNKEAPTEKPTDQVTEEASTMTMLEQLSSSVMPSLAASGGEEDSVAPSVDDETLVPSSTASGGEEDSLVPSEVETVVPSSSSSTESSSVMEGLEEKGQDDVDDMDEDGVLDVIDVCPNTAIDERADKNGCSIDQWCPCELNWESQDHYMMCVLYVAKVFLQESLMTAQEHEAAIDIRATWLCG